MYIYTLENQLISQFFFVIWEIRVAKPWMVNVKSDWLPLFTVSTKQVYYSNAFLSRGWLSIKPLYRIPLFHFTRVSLLVRILRGEYLNRVFLTRSLPIYFVSSDKWDLFDEQSLSQLSVLSFGNFDLEESLTVEHYGRVKNNFVDVVFTWDSGRS